MNILQFPLSRRLADYKRSRASKQTRPPLELSGPGTIHRLHGSSRSRLAAIRKFRSERPDLWATDGIRSPYWHQHATKTYPAEIDWEGSPPDRSRTGHLYTSSPASFFREVGNADDIVNLRHTGWYVDAFADETTVGVVYQLPGRNGEPRYLPAVREPWGTTRISADICHDKESAARQADSLAESFAELCREDAEEQETTRKLEELTDEATDLRTEIRTLARAIAHGHAHPPAIMEAAKAHLATLRHRLRTINKQRSAA